MLGNLNIKVKLLGIIFGVIIIVSTILAIQSVNSIREVSNANIEKYKKEAYLNKEEELKNYVSVAMSTVDSFYQRGTTENITKEVQKSLSTHTNQIFSQINNIYEKYKGKISKIELQNKIKEIIKTTRYGSDGYFWINDFDSVMIEHAVAPRLNGKSLHNLKDTNGKFFFREFSNVVKQKGEGFVDYYWNKPNFDTPQLKISYVKVFKPYNWIIGTGAYVDDLTSGLKEEALQAISKMRYGKSGYFWINDTDVKMLMHPVSPKLNGKKLHNLKDANGKYFFKEFIKVAKQSKEGGLVEYVWKKPEKETPQPKFSYVRIFEEWNWIIGTGAYVDDIEDKINSMRADTKEKIQMTIIYFIIESLVIIAIISILVALVINKIVVKPLKGFQDGLLLFFKYLNKEASDVKMLDDKSGDEIGHMSKVVNENIKIVQKSIEEDRQIIDETVNVLSEFEQGDLCQRLTMKVSNPALNELKNVLNNMGDTMEKNIDNILNILEQYSNYNYLNKVDTKGLKEHLEKLAGGVNSLGDSITNMLVENKSNGLTLDESSNVLLENVDVLNKNSSETATSLEQTAAALEEITSNIQSNTQNVVEMSNYANELTDSANEGESLANQTASSMDEINEQVNAINEAITVIDQIAFQTNILSLNAAVEAATAGEAGKGFAVVAGEVRNLAARSADAANEIKTLVENATQKTSYGKSIADKMITGYNHLNKNIENTLTLISDVEGASKEQQSGIEQINNAIAQLDQQTQANVEVANSAHVVAQQTDVIAKLVVSNANAKEFKGKDSVKVKSFDNNSISKSHNLENEREKDWDDF